MKLRDAAAFAPEGRSAQLRAGVHLEAISLVWNIAEGMIAVAAGTLAGSTALLAFGIDSFVETASGAIVGWRLLDEIRNRSEERAERVEKLTSHVAGLLLFALAIYIAVDSSIRLIGKVHKTQRKPDWNRRYRRVSCGNADSGPRQVTMRQRYWESSSSSRCV